MSKVIAAITVKATDMDDEHGLSVIVNMDSKCQCETCNYNHAVLFMGAVMQLIEHAELDFDDIVAQAQQMSHGQAVLH